MAPIGDAVFATLLMNDGYLPGAMVLGHSLKDRGAKGKLVAFVLLDRLAADSITELRTVYDDVVSVKQILNKTPANLYLMDRPDLISTFTKIELWRQMQYSRIVYLDADMVSLRAPNELLTMDTHFAAVPDIGWPDCFNSGMMVLNPNMAEYYALLALAERGISFDGADQGLLNMHFTEWERLSFKYNCTPSGNYQYLPAYRHFQSGISMLHFIGKDKPWTLGRTSRKATGVYAELLARWWTTYDRHYQAQDTVYYPGKYQEAPKKLQDHVSGEETIYLPAYQKPKGRAPSTSGTSASTSSGPTPSVRAGSTSMPRAPPSNYAIPPSEQPAPAIEESMGDQPAVEEQIQKEEFTPTPTVQQRRWSAPHAEWEPARAPPPTNAKPEAANFPTVIYEMSESRQLFQPPASYPEAPKDMWYEVPAKVVPPLKPKQIFPWESRAAKPTRVFAEPVLPSPPPEPLFPPDEPDVLDTTTSPSAPTESDTSSESTDVTREPYVDPWTTFNQRTNAWDEMPEITRYMQSITQAKKGKIQVLHHTPSTSADRGSLTSPLIQGGRRDSARVTDFPTEHERPSLPVTPAPRRRTLWGDDRVDLPGAEGVPRQAEWVRRFSSYPTPAFAAAALSPLIQTSGDTLYFECQHCGKQNPVAQLDELQQRQSETMLNKELGTLKEPPKREMPESESKEAVVKATEKALSPPARVPLKPILKEPKFGISAATPASEPEPAPEAVSKAVSAPPSNTELAPILASSAPIMAAVAASTAASAIDSEPALTSASIPASNVVPEPKQETVSAPKPELVLVSNQELESTPEPVAEPVPVSIQAPIQISAPAPVPAPAPAVIAAPPAVPVTARETPMLTKPTTEREISASEPASASTLPRVVPAQAPPTIAAPPAAIEAEPTAVSLPTVSTLTPQEPTSAPAVPSIAADVTHGSTPSTKPSTPKNNPDIRAIPDLTPVVIAAPLVVPTAVRESSSVPESIVASETLLSGPTSNTTSVLPIPTPAPASGVVTSPSVVSNPGPVSASASSVTAATPAILAATDGPSPVVKSVTAGDTSATRAIPDLTPVVMAAPLVVPTAGHESSSVPESIVASETLLSGPTSNTTSVLLTPTPASASEVATSPLVVSNPEPASASLATAATPAILAATDRPSPVVKSDMAEDTSATRAIPAPLPVVINTAPTIQPVIRGSTVDKETGTDSDIARGVPSNTTLPTPASAPAPSVIAAPVASTEKDLVTAPAPVHSLPKPAPEAAATPLLASIPIRGSNSAVETITPAPLATSTAPVSIPAANSESNLPSSTTVSSSLTVDPVPAPTVPTVTPMYYDAITMPFESDRVIRRELDSSAPFTSTASGQLLTQPILASEAMETAARVLGGPNQSSALKLTPTNLSQSSTGNNGRGFLDEYLMDTPTDGPSKESTIESTPQVPSHGSPAAGTRTSGTTNPGTTGSTGSDSPTASPTNSSRNSRSGRHNREHRHSSGSRFLGRVQSLLHRSSSRDHRNEPAT